MKEDVQQHTAPPVAVPPPGARREKKGKEKGKKARPFHIHVLRGALWSVLALALYFFAVDVNFLWLFGKSPSTDELKAPKQSIASEIYSADGQLLGTYYSENRSPVVYKQIPQNLIDALVSTEDARFYDHNGIDPQAIAAVAWGGLTGRNRGGGSTITQQLAKNLFKTRKVSRGLLGGLPLIGTVISKTKEWMLAWRLERNFEKQEILTLYLNTVDFGSNTFGLKTAARTFFNTTPDSLTVTQSALLVGLLKAPSHYSPILNPKNCLKRRNVVLAQMVKYGKLAQPAYATLAQKPLGIDFHIEQQHDGPGAYFRGVMNNYLKKWGKENGYDLYGDGLRIYTTIDSGMQHLAEEAVFEHMKALQRRFDQHCEETAPWVDERNREMTRFVDSLVKRTPYYKAVAKKYPVGSYKFQRALLQKRPMRVFTYKGPRDTHFSVIDSIAYYKRFLRAGFMAMDPHTGNIKAWVGGVDYEFFKFDHVKQAKRQPGSTFKPFVYAAAIDGAGYCPCDRIKNRPVTINYVEKGEKKSWSPHNADGVFDGDSMTLRHALAMSINGVAAQITEKIGWNKVAEYAHRCGIQSPLAEVPSVCLGSSDVSLYELVGAYGTFVNGGEWIEPMFLTKITDRNGKVLKEFKPKRRRAVSEETAFLMMDMLKGGLDEGGTSSNLWSYDIFKNSREGNDMGGKTGTSNNHSDGWFVGVSKGLVGGSWVGGEDRCIHFRSSQLGEGAKTALPIFGMFMEKVYAHPELGVEKGRFPKAAVKITKQYNCHTRFRAKKKEGDSTAEAGGEGV